ncbi:MAG TPA: HD domain-containing phosphohydrolase [Polyangiaceae bacterium]|nr:HD domain-containing phosphohydrolase [Polyangiaceae bacterium]
MQKTALNKRIADRLLADGLIQPADHDMVVEWAKQRGARVEEALLELGVIDETKLLKFIATMHKTQFVSTERMGKAKLDREALKVVSYKLATHFGIFPLVLDRKNDKLIVAMADPDNALAIKELQMAARVTRVLPMVARPAAVQAAIARGYEGDRRPFQRLLEREVDFERDPFGERRPDVEPAPRPSGGRPSVSSMPAVLPLPEVSDSATDIDWDPEPTPDLGSRPLPFPLAPPDVGTDPGFRDPRDATPRAARAVDDEVEPHSDPTPKGYSSPPAVEGGPLSSNERRSLIPPMQRLSHASFSFGPVTGRAERQTNRPDPIQVLESAPYLESLRVLVGLLENDRPDLRGHSSAVARLSLDICERIALQRDPTNAVVLAAYIHDLGKMGSLHLTTLNVALHGDYRKLAHKLYSLPHKLMESVGLPHETVDAVLCMYEQVDGRGVPDGLVGKEIPMGARILAVADTYADLTRNARNAHGSLLTPEKAVEVLHAHSGTVFDGNIVAVLHKAMSGEKILTDLLADRHRVLIVDPDPEETMVLQLRLTEQGFDVHVARGLEEARSALSAHEFALVVSEVDLEHRGGGFELRRLVRSTKNLPMSWVFLSGSSTREHAERAFELGVDDFLTKPIATEIVIAKLMQLIERQSTRVAPRGVSGSLSEMGLPDIVQILWHGRKTCALRVSRGDQQGEIHFSEGLIVDARWGEIVGEAAFYRLLALRENGEFTVDPDTPWSGVATISTSPEALLLEGMRLLDEGQLLS